MNEKSVFLKKTTSYVKVSRFLLRSKLSITAKGLLATMLDYDNFAIHKETEQVKSGVGKKKFNDAWAELERNGFIRTKKKGSGQIKYEYTIINDPRLNDENPSDENQERETTGENPEVEYQERNISSDKRASNIEVTNLDVMNVDVSSKEEINVDVSTLGKIDPVGTVDVTVEVISDTDNKSLQPVQTNNDDWIERFKMRVRLYVVSNNINPTYVKDVIEEFYSIKEYIPDNKLNLSEDMLFRNILTFTGMHKMHQTNSKTSIQNRLLEKLNDYLISNNIDRLKAESNINRYITDEDFYSLKQNQDLELAFKQLLARTQLYKFRNTKINSPTSIN